MISHLLKRECCFAVGGHRVSGVVVSAPFITTILVIELSVLFTGAGNESEFADDSS